MRLWHEVGTKWNGNVAAKVYQGPVLQALRRIRPGAKAWKVLEDNDPTGFLSTPAVKAKKRAKISVFKIPVRSPDLNPLDYAVWKQVTRKMRAQERHISHRRWESRAELVARLHKVAKGLSKKFVERAIGDMRRRCQRLYAAKGAHFEEGGLGK